MKVFTTDQIRMADAFTIAHEPVRSLDLMERAALGLASRIVTGDGNSSNIRIFAGFGNNGGDGLALARLLSGKGMKVILHVIPPEKDWSPDAKANLDRLPENDCLQVNFLRSDADLPVIQPDDLVIDAIFGSGLTREPAGFIADIIDHINRAGARVISVDIPSGLFGEDNRLNSLKHVVRASKTLTFQFPKLCFFQPQLYQYTGEWEIIPIGLHPEFIRNEYSRWNYTGSSDVKGWVKTRQKYSHKGSYGHALLIAGSKGKAGAAALSASACIRSGAGLTTVMIPSDCNSILQIAVPEAMTIPDANPDRWTTAPDPTPFTTIGVGPGIGTDPDSWLALESLLNTSLVPLVLDADALNLLSLNPGSLLQVPKNSILTPHPGEYKRLFGEDADDYSKLMRLKEMAETYQLVIVLKGAHTAVAGPDGSVWFNTTGNPGMATGGSGDVLTGLLTGLLAQGYDPFTAARFGVFLHGLAGDLAAADSGQEALRASDIVNFIGKAFLQIHHYQS